MHAQTFEVERTNPSTTRVCEEELSELGPDEVLLAVDRFALTANNITYAVAGEMLGYWNFFPAENGWGRIPAMGYADVVASHHPVSWLWVMLINRFTLGGVQTREVSQTSKMILRTFRLFI